MSTIRNNAMSANRVLLKLDGEVVGMAQNCRSSDDYAPDGASGIGDIHVQEFVPTVARHSLSLTQLKFRNESLRAKGLIPENGDAALRGVEFDILIQDKNGASVLRKYIGCVFASGDIDVQKHQIVSGTAQFLARDVQGTGL